MGWILITNIVLGLLLGAGVAWQLWGAKQFTPERHVSEARNVKARNLRDRWALLRSHREPHAGR